MTIFHLKYSYLDWRAIPCRKKTICVYAVFFIIFSTFFLVDSRLDLIKFSKCMTWQSIFLLFFLFLFLSTPSNDECHRWPFELKRLFSCEDCFERLVFWSKVVYIIPVQREDYGSKVFQWNRQFWSTCPKTSIEVISEYHDLRDLCFWVIERVLAGLKL